MAVNRDKGNLVDIDIRAMPEALRLVPEAVIARVRWLQDGGLTGFPEEGLTVGALATLTCACYAEVGDDPTAREDRFWIWQCLEELVDRDPASALDCVVKCIAQCSDPHVLSCIAAGPLEDLIADHGPQVIGQIEELARRQPRFRYDLTGVWPLGEDEEGEI